MSSLTKNKQYFKFSAYGFLKNLRFFDAFLLLFFLENGITYTQIGILYAAREIITNVSEIPSGIIADTYGRKSSLIVAFLLYIISFLLFYVTSEFYVLLIAMLLFGVGEAFRSGTHKGMIMDYLRLNNWEDQKVDYYGHTRSWSQKGSAVSALFAGLLVLYSGSYRIIFLVSALPYIINFFNIYSYPKELNHSLRPSKNNDQKRVVFTFRSFVSVLKKPKVLQIINSAALHTAFLKAIKDYIQPILVSVALLTPVLLTIDAKRKTGLIIGIIYFFIFLLTSYASRIAFRVSKLNVKNLPLVTLFLGFIAGVICGILYIYELWILSLVAFVLVFVLENLRKPLLTGEIADAVPNEILTSVISAQSFYRTVLTATLALLLGIFADLLGIGKSLLIVSSFLVLITLIIGIIGNARN